MVGLSGYRCCTRSPVYEAPERSIVYTENMVYQVLAVSASTVVIPKYRYPGGGPLYSRVARTRLDRVVWRYTPEELHGHTSVEDVCLGGPVPAKDGFGLVCDPRCRREELLREARDDLEIAATQFIAELEAAGVRVYPTGSLLGYYHDPRLSDIDIVLYIEESTCSRAVEAIGDMVREPSRREILEWSKAKGVDPNVYRRYSWGLYRERRVSIVYAASNRRVCSNIYVYNPSSTRRVRVWVEPGQCSALIWPHTVVAEEDGEPVAVVSFDGVYAPLLYEGGVLLVEGVAGRASIQCRVLNAIVLGLAENRGVIRILQTP